MRTPVRVDVVTADGTPVTMEHPEDTLVAFPTEAGTANRIVPA